MKHTGFAAKPFAGLKKALERKGSRPAYPRETLLTGNPSEKTDCEVFTEAMADVREIPGFRRMSAKEPGRCPSLNQENDGTVERLQAVVDGRERISLPDTDEYMEWRRPGMKRDITERLHRGDFSVQECIDLHGITRAEAEEEIEEFFREAVRRGVTCVKVIHGRGLRSPGGPVIKETVKELFARSLRKYVLAYATARNCDGGLGATYVLLDTRVRGR
jgi:DNA-nicking Smr family endonuclease